MQTYKILHTIAQDYHDWLLGFMDTLAGKVKLTKLNWLVGLLEQGTIHGIPFNLAPFISNPLHP